MLILPMWEILHKQLTYIEKLEVGSTMADLAETNKYESVPSRGNISQVTGLKWTFLLNEPTGL